MRNDTRRTGHALKKEIATPVFALARNDRGCDEVHSEGETERFLLAERHAPHCTRMKKA